MPTKGKSKAKSRGRNTKDTLQTLALSRNAAHLNQKGIGESSSISAAGLLKARTRSRGSLTTRNSFSPFHMRNAAARVAIMRK